MTSFALTLSPVPTFLFCYKSKKEQLASLDSISFLYLLSSFATSAIWLAYALKITNPDIALVSIFGKKCLP